MCRRRHLSLFASLFLCALSVGCETKVEPLDSSNGEGEVVSGSRSTLGKARDRAKDIERRAEEYNEHLEKQMEEQ